LTAAGQAVAGRGRGADDLGAVLGLALLADRAVGGEVRFVAVLVGLLVLRGEELVRDDVVVVGAVHLGLKQDLDLIVRTGGLREHIVEAELAVLVQVREDVGWDSCRRCRLLP
jgi:hypothetical protein